MPRGQGTITLHAVQMHKQRLFLHKQFLNLNVKIRQHVNVRHVLGKHTGAVRMLWAEHAEVQVPWLSQHRGVIHRHPTCGIYLKQGSIVTLRIFTDSWFLAWTARPTLMFSSLYFDKGGSVQSSNSNWRGGARTGQAEPWNFEQGGCSCYGVSGRIQRTVIKAVDKENVFVVSPFCLKKVERLNFKNWKKDNKDALLKPRLWWRRSFQMHG